jgi:hypothetical protein
MLRSSPVRWCLLGRIAGCLVFSADGLRFRAFPEEAEAEFCAQKRLDNPQPGITSNQLRKSLGLDG